MAANDLKPLGWPSVDNPQSLILMREWYHYFKSTIGTLTDYQFSKQNAGRGTMLYFQKPGLSYETSEHIYFIDMHDHEPYGTINYFKKVRFFSEDFEGGQSNKEKWRMVLVRASDILFASLPVHERTNAIQKALEERIDWDTHLAPQVNLDPYFRLPGQARASTWMALDKILAVLEAKLDI